MTLRTTSQVSLDAMGRVLAKLTITNRIDQANAQNGLIPHDQIRSVELDDVLVDTGATTLCLSAETISQLGLELLREVQISTANGIGTARIFQDAKISLCGREGTFECLELPGGQNPLVGVIPMEALGLDPDRQNQRLRVLPISSTETYLTIL
ncbi:MAG: retroviral-like aspartic protease family protein [Cyanobacteria bacterium P01_A01_bin.70]